MRYRNAYNHDFFKTWSDNMAYCLGFITTDGCIQNKKPYIVIELARKDHKFLESIRDVIAPTNKIAKYKKYSKKHNKTYYSSVLVIYSKEMVFDLKDKFQIVPNKTFCIRSKFNIEENFIPSYLRGIFDGDGSIYLGQKKKDIRVSICSGSRWFLYDLRKFYNCGQIRSVKQISGKLLYNWELYSHQANNFLEFIYSTSGPFLERKKNIWIKNR